MSLPGAKVRNLSPGYPLQSTVGPEEEIYKLAKSFEKEEGLSAKDAVHLACASHAGANFFLTCDDILIRRAERLKLEMKILNPVDYIREEVK